MHNTRHLPENFEQCRLEKTISQHFPYTVEPDYIERSRETEIGSI